MPLTPEQQQRIDEEERQRLEQEIYRNWVRDRYKHELAQRQREDQTVAPSPITRQPAPARRNRLLWMYLAVLLFLSFVVARQFGWLRRGPRAGDTTEVATAQPPTNREPRAVFGDSPAKSAPTPEAAAPAPTPRRQTSITPPPKPSAAQPVAETGTRNRIPASAAVPPEIHNLLRRWEDTVRNTDAEQQASLYAPTAEVYFTKRNVSRDQILADKRQMFRTYPTINRYTVSNVRLESLTDNRASISLIKDWDAQGTKRFAGSEKEILTLARLNGEWKIVGEKEIHVFWRKKE